MNKTLTLSALMSSLLLGACATSTQAPPALVEARNTVRSAETNPAVNAMAPLELKKATDTLARANMLQSKGDSPGDIQSTAYVASQQARTAMAIAQAKGNDAAIAGAEAERERARADMRTLEAQRARAQAEAARSRPAPHASRRRKPSNAPAVPSSAPRMRSSKPHWPRPRPARRRCRPPN